MFRMAMGSTMIITVSDRMPMNPYIAIVTCFANLLFTCFSHNVGSVNDRLSSNFQALSSSIDAFVNEVKLLGLWDNVVVVQFTEFGRTLRPNSSSGTDHGW